jgi:hypothetical protein
VRRSDVVSFMPPLTFAQEVESGVLRSIKFVESSFEHASVDIVTSRRHVLPSAPQAFLQALLAKVR